MVRMVDLSVLVAESDIVGDSPEDALLLRRMAIDARNYLSSHSWCPGITALHLGVGVGGVAAVFLASLDSPVEHQGDEQLWVVVGDLPPYTLLLMSFLRCVRF